MTVVFLSRVFVGLVKCFPSPCKIGCWERVGIDLDMLKRERAREQWDLELKVFITEE